MAPRWSNDVRRRFAFTRGPIALLTVTLAVSCIILAWLGCRFYQSQQRAIETSRLAFRLEELHGAVLHLDEVLTMSACMAAVTGDRAWEERYTRCEPLLGRAIRQIKDLSRGAFGDLGVATMDAANDKLVEAERRAFALARQGRRAEAQACLSSDEYLASKKAYARGMNDFCAATHEAVRSDINRQEDSNVTGSVTMAVIYLLLSLGWYAVLRSVRKWKVEIESANCRLAKQSEELDRLAEQRRLLNESLDQQVLERTVQLRSALDEKDRANTAMQQEIAARKLTEEALLTARQAAELDAARTKSLVELSQMGDATPRDLATCALETGIHLTGSRIGYIAFVDESEGTLTMQYWSKDAMAEYRIVDKPIAYRLEDTGLWGDAVRQRRPAITNDYSSDIPGKQGVPEGHVPLVRHMNVPIFDGPRIVAVAGVGNKDSNYSQGDVNQLALLMDGMWKLIRQRQAEEALRESESRYRSLFENLLNGFAYCQMLFEDGRPVDFRYISVNDAFEQLTGLKDVVGKLVTEVVPGIRTSNPELFDVYGRVSQTGRPERYEGYFPSLDSWFSVSAYSTQPGFFVAVFENITERVRLTAELVTEHEHLATTLRSIGDGVIATDAQGRIVLLNKSAEQLTGWSAAEAFGRPIGDVFVIVNEMTRETVVNPVDIVLETGLATELAGHTALIARDGSERSIADSCAPVLDAASELHGVVLVFRDVTEKRRAEDEMRQAKAFLNAVVENIPIAVFAKDAAEHRFTLWNRAAEEMFGLTASEVLGKTDYDFFPKEQADLFWQRDSEALSGGCVLDIPEEPVGDPGIERRHLHTRKVPMNDPGGQAQHVLCISEDITDRKRDESQIRLHAAALDAADDIIAILNRDGLIVFANNAFQRQADSTLSEIIGRDLSVLVAEKECLRLQRAVSASIETGVVWTGELLCRQKGESSYTADVAMTPLRGIDGHTEHLIVIARNITERKVYEDLLDYQAHHDALTGLPNRQLFCDQLASVLSDRRKRRKRCAVLFIDLDRFKLVNDTMGHQSGDALLVEVAARLGTCLRDGDVLARMGGDEFTVLLRQLQAPEEAGVVAGRMLELLSQPFEIGRSRRGASTSRMVIGASIGISTYPDNATTVSGLLRNADVAMYRAKELGRNNCQFYSEELNQANLARMETERDLRLAMRRKELAVVYQPIVELKSMRVVGAEALLRWDHPSKGMISPGVFVPIAEETGLIADVGISVLESACAQGKRWNDLGYEGFEVSVNVSGLQLQKKGFVSDVLRVLTRTGLPPECLNLEITETVLAGNDYGEVDTLCKLNAHGIKTCLDDFGIGYSSLSRLRRFPVVHMKVDGSFIRDIEHNSKDRAMTESIVRMAHSLGIQVTVEWVETDEQLAAVRALGCEYAQGFLISPALSADEFDVFLGERDARRQQERAA